MGWVWEETLPLMNMNEVRIFFWSRVLGCRLFSVAVTQSESNHDLRGSVVSPAPKKWKGLHNFSLLVSSKKLQYTYMVHHPYKAVAVTLFCMCLSLPAPMDYFEEYNSPLRVPSNPLPYPIPPIPPILYPLRLSLPTPEAANCLEAL